LVLISGWAGAGRGRAAKAATPEVERTIFDDTSPEKKAVYLPATLRMIGQEREDFHLEFLADLSVEEALAWLERLPGATSPRQRSMQARFARGCSSSMVMCTGF
jgi:hypothetical protein